MILYMTIFSSDNMTEYLNLEIPTSLKPPIKLSDILYNCPVCDYEIEIDMFVDDDSFVTCGMYNHIIKLQIKKI